MKTQQIGSQVEPIKENDTLAFIIKCPKCRTQRAFRVNDSFALVATRKSSGLEIDTWCVKCSRRIAIQLVWTQRQLKWPSEKIVFQKAVTVEDHFGMNPQHDEKIV